MFNEIIVPVDGSPFGELALPVALGVACKSGGEVRMVTVPWSNQVVPSRLALGASSHSGKVPVPGMK